MYIIYSKQGCPACEHAKSLLESKNLEYKEYELDLGQAKLERKSYVTVPELLSKVPGAKTVPQIFKNSGGSETFIGGFNELQSSFN